jgi:hypothetical protein
MIGIKIGGSWLDLYPDTVITFELNSPAYFGENIDIIQSDYSFPLNVPLTNRNRGILRNPDLIDNVEPHLVDQNCEIWSSGLPVFRGKFSITSSNTTQARCNIIMSPLGDLKNVKMNELDWGEADFGSTNPAKLEYAKNTALNPEDYDFIFFPIWNWKFDGRNEYDLSRQEWQNYYDIYTEKFINVATIPAMPFLKLSKALELGSQYIQYQFQNFFQVDTELKRLVLYNNYDMHTTDTDDNIIRPQTIKLAQHANPDTYFTDLLKQVCRNFCLAPFINYWERTFDLVPLKNLLAESPVHDWSKKISAEYDLSTNSDLPGQFGYNNIYEYAPTNEFFDREKIDYELASTFVTDINSPQGFYLEYITDQIWELYIESSFLYYRKYSYAMPPYIADASSKNRDFESDLKTLFTPLVGVNEGGTDGYSAKFPSVALEGSSYNKKNAYTDMLLFYRGFEGCTKPGKTYPMAGSTIYNGARTITEVDGSPAKYALTWRGPNGLYNVWWKDWYNRLKTKKTVVAEVQLSEAELRSFNFRDKVRVGNRNAFVKKMKVTLTHAGIQPIEAELVIM